ncbi:MAG: hypothetical protein ACP5QK_00700 [Myxococcota bacterium]
MRIVIKIIVALLLIPLIGGYASALFNTALVFINNPSLNWHFLTGIGAGILLFPILMKRRFIRTFEHEMTHLIFAKLFLGNIKELNVSSEGSGYVEYSAFPNPFIGLSPYFFPLFAAIIALLVPLLNPIFSKYFYIAVGFFLVHHLLSAIIEISSSQPDIKQEGILFSAVFISFFLILFYGIIISEIISYAQILIFFKTGLIKSLSILMSIKDLFTVYLLALC